MKRNLTWGLRWGLIGGVVYAVFAAIILTAKGWPDLGVPPGFVILAYPLAGLVSGVVLGLLRPVLNSRRNAALAGPLVGLPAMVVLLPLAVGSPLRWGVAEWFGTVLTAVILGSMAGYKWWEIAEYDPSADLSVPPAGSHRRRDRRQRR